MAATRKPGRRNSRLPPFPGEPLSAKRLDRAAGSRAPLTDRILAVIKAIPRGKVAGYGQVAALAGSPRGARQVARVLHSLSAKEKLPWHRVIGATGRISLPAASGGAEQARRLKREGVAVDGSGKIDLARHRWEPR